MVLLSRLRLALARRPWLYWLFVACCAAIIWSTLATNQAKLDDQRRRWGETRRVWVAAVDIAPGDVVRSVARDYPIAMVAASAIIDQPAGVIATSSISAGEVLVAADIDETGDDLLPPDWVVFALSNDHTPSLHQGDDVAVFGSGQRWCDGVVAAVGDDTADIGVPPTCADAVSVQIAAGTLVLATVN
jgi:hypothetical protein